jgi:hypothetical protein
MNQACAFIHCQKTPVLVVVESWDICKLNMAQFVCYWKICMLSKPALLSCPCLARKIRMRCLQNQACIHDSSMLVHFSMFDSLCAEMSFAKTRNQVALRAVEFDSSFFCDFWNHDPWGKMSLAAVKFDFSFFCDF